METFQIQLPLPLAQQIRQLAYPDDELNKVVAQAIQQWLVDRKKDHTERKRALKALRDAGLVMSSERQRALAKAMIAKLPPRDTPTRAQVEASLSKLKVPLSEEIIAMRGER